LLLKEHPTACALGATVQYITNKLANDIALNWYCYNAAFDYKQRLTFI